MIAFGWFNPVFYLYRSKIRQNHEFLADDAVIKNNKECIPAYQTILIKLDGKRIENAELNRYQPSDFSYYSVSRLERNAKNYGKHVYQLNLYTIANYQAWKKSWEEKPILRLVPNLPQRVSQ